MTTAPDATDTWVLQSEARRRLRISPVKLRALIEAGHISTLSIPGSHTRIKLADVEALIAAHTKPATCPSGEEHTHV